MGDHDGQRLGDLLNRATIAWVEQEYQRSTHSEIGTSPLERYLSSKNVGRESPSLDTLRRALRMQVQRAQRRSDGTVSVEAVRFEVPSAYRTLASLTLRVARWDLSNAHLVDPRTEAHLATLLPLDKRANADGRRRAISVATNAPAPPATGIAPLLRSLMAEYAATGRVHIQPRHHAAIAIPEYLETISRMTGSNRFERTAVRKLRIV